MILSSLRNITLYRSYRLVSSNTNNNTTFLLRGRFCAVPITIVIRMFTKIFDSWELTTGANKVKLVCFRQYLKLDKKYSFYQTNTCLLARGISS